ncbi:hypothetical protein LMG33818_000055 [Halomonadaceae bacterium LMG 33818]|uniref:phage baseplate protein n=1 Tax=Cernens ardua TaxID=3402176 RepID=UPI003EDCAC45
MADIATGTNSVTGIVSTVSGSLTETTALQFFQGDALLASISNTLHPAYSVTFNSISSDTLIAGTVGQSVFEPTSWVSVQASSESGVVNAPIELGNYASINKVRRPRSLTIIFTLEGWTGYSGQLANYSNFSILSRTRMLEILEQMKRSTNTYNIATPDTVYESFDLQQFSYSVSSGNGMTLLRVTASFTEVLPVSETLLSTHSLLSQNGAQSSAATTQKVNSLSANASLGEINQAYSSASGGTPVTGSAVTSNAGSATDMITQSYGVSSDQSARQKASGISRLLGAIT